MTTTEIKVNLAGGLHARPASKFVQLAKRFNSKLIVSFQGKSVDPKSIIGLLSLGVSRGAVIIISADGEDEAQAISALCAYLKEEE